MPVFKNLFDISQVCAFPALLVAVFVTSLPAQEVAEPIKVMSFNIRYGTAADGENHWEQRHHLVREAIQVANPDLLGVQEALPFQCEFLKQHLPDYEFFGRGREAEPDQGEFCAILFRRSRFTKIDGGHFWLSETPDQPGSRSWDSSLPRMVTWVRLQEKQSGDEFLFANTHFDHRGARARGNSALAIRNWLQSRDDLPFVLTGDFNAAFDSKPYRNLTGLTAQGALHDTYRTIYPEPHPEEGTFGGWENKRDGARIDWIVHNKHFRTLNARINYYNDSGQFPSDHFPVEATIRLAGHSQ